MYYVNEATFRRRSPPSVAASKLSCSKSLKVLRFQIYRHRNALPTTGSVSRSTTYSIKPPEKTKITTDTFDLTASMIFVHLSRSLSNQKSPSTSLEPRTPAYGVRQFRTPGGLRGESPSPAPLSPPPDVSEVPFYAAGSRNLFPPQPPSSSSPSKKPRRSPTSKAYISLPRPPSPTTSRRSPSPDCSVDSKLQPLGSQQIGRVS